MTDMHLDSESEAVRRTVRRLVAEMMPSGNIADVGPSDRLHDELGYGSLDLVELAVRLEDEFSLPAVSEEEAIDVMTVGDIETLILKKMGGG
jgi:acyl carrier protein